MRTLQACIYLLSYFLRFMENTRTLDLVMVLNLFLVIPVKVNLGVFRCALLVSDIDHQNCDLCLKGMGKTYFLK